jgi:hypothetical protein
MSHEPLGPEPTDRELLDHYDRLYERFQVELRELFVRHGPQLHAALAREVKQQRRSPLRAIMPFDLRVASDDNGASR